MLLVAPFLGEVMSTSTPPLTFVRPWILGLQIALYGCGALLCRELAHRLRLGVPGLLLLAAAYAVYEEAIIVRSWFDSGYQQQIGIGSYSRVWDTNLLLAAHLTAFHITVSIGCSVVVVERLFPRYRTRPWTNRGGLVAAAVGLGVIVPLTYGDLTRGPHPQVLTALAVITVLAVTAIVLPRRLRRRPATTGAPEPVASPPRFVGLTAFACTGTHFVLTYTIPSTGWPWPVGALVAVSPIVVGAVLALRLARRGRTPDGLKVATGVLGFFVVLDVFVGLLGAYDLVAAAVLAAAALIWLGRRR